MKGHSGSKFDFPARYVLGIWAFLGFILVFSMRVNLSVTIVAMVNRTTVDASDNVSYPEACPELTQEFQNGTPESEKELRGEFDWDPKAQSLLLGAFFYGYVVALIPCAIVAGKWSAKWLFGLSVLMTSILTLLSPLAARWSILALAIVRIIEGFAQGAMGPSCNTLISGWSPTMERSRFSSFVHSGIYLGSAVGLSVAGVLCDSQFLGGWPSAFYVFGICGCVWFIFWTSLIHERPEEHPRISRSELIYIAENRNQKSENKQSIPWISILTSIPAWACFVSFVGIDWGLYTLMILMPTYLSNILHFNIQEDGTFSSLPYILQTLSSWGSSYMADKIRQSGKLRITTIRRIFNSIGIFGAGLCMLLTTFVGCRPNAALILLSLSPGFSGVATAGSQCAVIDMAPQFAGLLMGISLFFGNCSGFLVTYISGTIRESGETLHNWSIIFGISCGIYFFTGLAYLLFSSAEAQSWNDPLKDPTVATKPCAKKSTERYP